jgi:hypothetical protein
VSEPIDFVDWIPIFLSLRRILRWLQETEQSKASEYLITSSARDLLERLRPDLQAADLEVPPQRSAQRALHDLRAVLSQIFEFLDID